jgi:type VI secretion system protein ImpJ
MSATSRVVWSQGMFLQPQHFQQESRFQERLLEARIRAVTPFGWGFQRLVLDEAALALGKVALAEAVGVLPDGSAFAVPALDPAPLPFDVPADLRDEVLLLALPLRRAGAPEVDMAAAPADGGRRADGSAPDSAAGADGADPLARYVPVQVEARDSAGAASDEPVTIQVGRLRLVLLRAREATDAYAVLGCVRIQQRRPDNQVVLHRDWIAPQTTIAATPHLVQVATLIQGLLAQRAQALAARMGQLGHGVSEVAHFLMLQMFNRHEPVFAQHARLANVHPRELYTDCVTLAGEFCTFVGAQRRASTYPVYRHDDPAACFAPVIAELRDSFAGGIEDNALQIALVDRNFGVRTAAIQDLELVRSGAFVLAVNAQVPGEQLRTRFLAQTKLGPVERIRDLVNLQLPGIALRGLPVAPRQLPYHAGFYYFELERNGDLWKQLEKTGNLAIHVAGDFPGLELELWAIRQKAG